MELKMLFCQQKNVNRVTTITAIVVAMHCFVVWFICLKTVVHHFEIPLFACVQPIKIKLNRSIPVVKNKGIQSVQQPHNKKIVPQMVAQKPSKSHPAVQPSHKVSVQKKSNKATNIQKNVPKNSEVKKLVTEEVQKSTQLKEIETVKKADTISPINSVDHAVQPKIDEQNDEANIDNEVQATTVNTIDYYDLVYATIIEQWRPPIGIVKGTSCTVSFTIDKAGLPTDIVFDKKSGSLMFDMSIKVVLAHGIFSPLFVGNRFSIVFTV
jgi:outer membrane biosynthesis protein TonB